MKKINSTEIKFNEITSILELISDLETLGKEKHTDLKDHVIISSEPFKKINKEKDICKSENGKRYDLENLLNIEAPKKIKPINAFNEDFFCCIKHDIEFAVSKLIYSNFPALLQSKLFTLKDILSSLLEIDKSILDHDLFKLSVYFLWEYLNYPTLKNVREVNLFSEDFIKVFESFIKRKEVLNYL